MYVASDTPAVVVKQPTTLEPGPSSRDKTVGQPFVVRNVLLITTDLDGRIQTGVDTVGTVFFAQFNAAEPKAHTTKPVDDQ